MSLESAALMAHHLTRPRSFLEGLGGGRAEKAGDTISRPDPRGCAMEPAVQNRAKLKDRPEQRGLIDSTGISDERWKRATRAPFVCCDGCWCRQSWCRPRCSPISPSARYRSSFTLADERIERSLDVVGEQVAKVFQSLNVTFDGIEAITRDRSDEQIHDSQRAASRAQEDGEGALGGERDLDHGSRGPSARDLVRRTAAAGPELVGPRLFFAPISARTSAPMSDGFSFPGWRMRRSSR